MSKKYNGLALVVGISVYTHAIHVENAINDMKAMRDNLERCNYKVLSLENPSKTLFEEELRELSKELIMHKYRNVVVFYAGHGAFNEEAHYLLLPDILSKDISTSDQIALHTLKVEDIIESICAIELDDGKELALVVILDCCRSAEFASKNFLIFTSHHF